MKVVTLLENQAVANSLCAAHGLSLYIETPKHRILFDMGPDNGFMENARALGVDLAAVDIAFLSHGHFDHGGGIAAFLAVNDTAKLYMQKEAFGEYVALEDDGERFIGINGALRDSDRIILTEGTVRIDDELLLFSDVPRDFDVGAASGRLFRRGPAGLEQDGFVHEQDLLITAEGKTILISGCSHRGIVNILHRARDLAAGEIDTMIGGFHLFQLEEGAPAADQLIEQLGTALLAGHTVYHTGHCTGDYAYTKLKSILGDRLHRVMGGTELGL